MVFKVHGVSLSTCTRLVGVTLREKAVPFELVAIDFRSGEHKKPEHLKYQPFGVVPYINDDGFILYESVAIARYIETKYASQGTPLIPADLKAKALFEQAMSIGASYFDPYAKAAVAEAVFKKYHGLETDQAVVDDNLEKLSAKLEVYNKILGKQKYLAGDVVTLADLTHLAYGTELVNAGYDVFSKYPNVARWWKDISTRDAWLNTKGGVASFSGEN